MLVREEKLSSLTSESTLNRPSTSNCIAFPATEAAHYIQTDYYANVDEYIFLDDLTNS